MYQSSEAFGNWIQQDSRTFQARITLEGKTMTEGILSIRLNGGSNSEDDFSLGSAVSRYVELEIEKTGTRFEGHEFLLELGLNGEYIQMGYFTAEKPKGDEERLSITAYDRMVKTERACFLELPDSTNTVAVLKGVGTIAGIEVVTEGLTAIPMKKPVGYTCREVLSYVAQLYGGFAICNRAGKIEIKSYEDNDYTVTAGRYWDSFTHNDLPFVLGKITCYTGKSKEGEDISIHVGDGVRGIYFSNPFMDQTALDNVWGKLRNYTYMPGSFRFLGDPRIDPWDVLTVKDRNGNTYKVPAMKLTQEYDGGLSTEVEAVGKTEAEQSTGFTGPNTQNLDRLYAQLVLIDHAMINKLDVDTAKITYATIDNLNALKAEIEQLDVTELTARVAKIEKAYITDAEVKTLLAGYATIGNLNATNAQITSLSGKFAAFEKTTTEELVAAKGWLLEGSIGDAQISRVSANKLTAGTIDTAIITVAGSDGHLRISDNTIQIKDLQRVRVQIGKDASGEYSLSVWDKTGKLIWDALGATESTIQRKIIRDKMVADDAAINALKLDLKSFNTALTEQGVSISGTVVQVGNKTLNVELTEQRQLTTEHGETLTDHAARITANENAVKLKVSTQEYESYKTRVNGEIATAKSRLNAAESSISVMKGQIALKVEQTDIEEAVNNIQVGGRNLLHNSKGDFVLKPRNDGTASDNYNNYGFHVDSLRVGETYTISADVEITHGSFRYVTVLPGDTVSDTYETAYTAIIPTNKRIICTFKKIKQTTTVVLLYAGVAGETRGNGIIFRKVKIEKGNKATDWTPAPEDIEEDIAEVDGKFVNYSTTVQMNAAITAAKDSITSTVSRTYATKTEISSVSGKVTSLESWKQEASQKITKDGILSTVGDYYATSKYVETMKTGSRNFIRNGNFAETTTSPGNTNKHHNLYPLGWGGYNGGISNPTTSWHAHIDNTTFGFNVVEFNESDGNRNWKGIAVSPDFIFIEKVDQEYRLSVDVYATGPGTRLTGGFYYCKKGESTQDFHAGRFEIHPKETNKWVRMSVAVPLNDDIDLKSKKTNLYIYGYSFTSNAILYIKDVALTTGNKTADWSPAVEETEMRIASAETIANQTSNKFLWLVKSGTSATNFELTDRTATLIANAINLKGLVTFSGLNSDTQSKINTAQSTANTAKNNAATAQSAANAAQSTANTAKNNAATAQSTANTAKSTADAVTSTVNANKANWDKGYNWTNSNGGNMINLLTMVKAWTGGAVSATTTINGGFIRTNTITAAQIALGDFTNLVDVNESLPQSAIPDNTHPFGSHAKPMCKNGYWYKESAASEYLALSSYKPNSFADGDELYYEFTAHSELAGNYFIALWFYNGTSKEFQTMKRGNIESVTTSDKTFSGIIKLEDAKKYDFFAIGIGDNNNTKIQIYVKNISVHKRNKGNLIVDGAITTDKLAAQAVTAAKINVKDLFAQDITATGTIRGVTLRGSKGEIGGFKINSTRLYSVDSSGTYAAYFGSYDFNKTNAFVAQTKVNGSWVNTLEMRYDGSIISRDKKNTNYRTTIQEGTVTCTGNDGWSTSTTVELRNGEIWFYRNKDSIEASIGFDEHGQNSNSATARVTRINASNSGLLLSCQNTPGLYIYKNSLRAWVNLDMNHKSIINSSDERLKTNILPFTSSVLPELGRLGIVSYAWKETGEQVKAGFTAQNMQSVFPELVEANDAGILGIKTLELMPYVVKGMQELTNKTEELQEQIKKVRCQQEGDTISLRAQVSSLQYQLQQAFNQLAIQAEQIKKLQAEG
ncbi:MAG: tail fiber domain-containing protein [Eubacteriales bacterium]|nr:tail fiber domain-containing protein [Eubacteriales bacterium]